MHNSFNTVNILDVTLRDGSYLIDFQFSEHDTAFISKALESSGIEWIEIGHGMGLGASEKGYGKAACKDEDYIRVAAQNLEKAKWGTFFIPEVGSFDDIRMAAKYKMPFIRIGTNITEVSKALPYIELAKSLGIFVAYNGMKSYAVEPAEFAEVAIIAEKAGADMVCLVDSAGGFYPSDIENYFRACADVTQIKLGYHGHDNLSLVMANTLKAIECGAFMVDTSIQGMGRSAGNAITEVLVAILKQKNPSLAMDLNSLIDLGQNIISPMILSQGADPLAIISGYARFHSSFTQKVQQYAKRFNLDVRDVIVKLCEEDKIDAPDELLERISKKLSVSHISRSTNFRIKEKKIELPDTIAKLKEIIREIKIRAVKYSRQSAINITINLNQTTPIKVSNSLYTSGPHLIGAVSVQGKIDLELILGIIEGEVDIVLLDNDGFEFDQVGIAHQILKKTIVFDYSDKKAWVWAVEEQIASSLNGKLAGSKITIIGLNEKSVLVAKGLRHRKAIVSIVSTENHESDLKISDDIVILDNHVIQSDVLVAWSNNQSKILDWANKNNNQSIVIDAGLGSIGTEAIRIFLEKNISLIRVNMWPVLSGILLSLHETRLIAHELRGMQFIDGIKVVSGDLIGDKGDIIVDNYKRPTRVLGIADGNGRVITNFDADDELKVIKIMEIIYNQLIFKPALNT